MSQYTATVIWQRRENEVYTDNKYSRAHQWLFDGGATVSASSSPYVVPLPYSVEDNVDPEEAFVASLSSCHMLFFLSVAAKRQLVVERYVDRPIGIMEKNHQGKMAMTKVTLRPEIRFSQGTPVTRKQLEAMHNQSHEQCFIASSVKTEIVIEIMAIRVKERMTEIL
ncbi:MAG: organic hydroperoxide reductase OsmC/OhrA [Granulosicoccus sp.]|jgi:organic hydroperoxide reductase OsmC/OhrA